MPHMGIRFLVLITFIHIDEVTASKVPPVSISAIANSGRSSCKPLPVEGCSGCPAKDHSTAFNWANKTVCYTSTKQDITIEHILSRLPVNGTKHLDIFVDNRWNGQFPMETQELDITNITRFKYLESLQILQLCTLYLKEYHLEFTPSKGALIPFLKSFRISITVSQDSDLRFLLAPLSALEYLHLGTRGIGARNLQHIISNMHPEAVTNLKLLQVPTFQLLTHSDYKPAIDFQWLTNNTSFNVLESLDVRDNSIVSISPGFTGLLPKLKKIDLSNNILLGKLFLPVLYEVIFSPTLVFINLDQQGFLGGNPSEDRTAMAEYPFEDEVNGDWNRRIFDTKGIETLHYKNAIHKIVQCLNKISMQESRNYNISFVMSSNISASNILNCVAPDFFQSQQPVFPPLRKMYNDACTFYMEVPLGERVQNISLSTMQFQKTNVFGPVLNGVLCLRSPNGLQRVNISNNANWLPATNVQESINNIDALRGFNQLEIIDMSRNNLSIYLDLFLKSTNLPSLKEFYFQENLAKFHKGLSVCDDKSPLKYLDLTRNHLQQNVTFMSFQNCNQLIYLKLSHNKLTGNFFNATQPVMSLEHIDLSHNSIQYLTPTSIAYLNNLKMKTDKVLAISLKENPLSCDCRSDALDFISWLIYPPPHLKFVDIGNSTCTSPRGIVGIAGIDTSRINNWRSNCKQNKKQEVLWGIAGCIVTAIVLLLVILLYRKRWQIRYKVFKMKEMMTKSGSNQRDSYKYDAFVAYSAEDRFCVHGILMKNLENFYGFNLCIHYRDFPVGAPIHDTIIEFIGKSQEIILVISDFFLSSEWCQFELDEALRQCNLRQSRLIVIKLGNPQVDQHLTMLHVMTCHVYLEWDDDPDGPEEKRSLFWAKLVGRMYSDETGFNWACCCKYGARAIGYQQI